MPFVVTTISPLVNLRFGLLGLRLRLLLLLLAPWLVFDLWGVDSLLLFAGSLVAFVFVVGVVIVVVVVVVLLLEVDICCCSMVDTLLLLLLVLLLALDWK